MKKKLSCINKLKLSSKVGFSSAAIFILAIVLMSVCLIVVYENIKGSQEQMPNDFFQLYNKLSLDQLSKASKQLINVFLQSRNGFLTLIRNIIIQQGFNKNSKLTKNQIKRKNQFKCLKSNDKDSMFNCDEDLYSTLVVEQSWDFLTIYVKFKRFNIFYKNNQNQSDIMVRTAARVDQITQVKVPLILQKMRRQKDGVMTYSRFYDDNQGRVKDRLLGFRTKITFPKYTVLLELESFGGCLTDAVKRLFYSSNVNLAILSSNLQNYKGYDYIASYQQLHPKLNFTLLLSQGNKILQIGNQTIFTKTVVLSSTYKLGSTHKNTLYANKDYFIVIYSTKVSLDMQHIIYGFIDRMSVHIHEFLFISFSGLVILILTLSCLKSYLIRLCLKTTKNLLKLYCHQPSTYTKILDDSLFQISKYDFFQPVFKNIHGIIKIIERKKSKQIKKQNYKQDIFPLNLLAQKFDHEITHKDIAQFFSIRTMLMLKMKSIK